LLKLFIFQTVLPWGTDISWSTKGNILRTVNLYYYVHSFIHQWLYSPFVGPGLFFSFVIFFTQRVGLLGRIISTSQGLYLYTGQHKHRINAHTNIHASSRIRTYDPSVRASEDSSCLRPLVYRDRYYYVHSRGKI
jgi:hypothetical protein